MKKILLSVLMLGTLASYAQDTYTNAELATEDLNGTARYVGMGGALDALGGDISTISTNPAGVGLIRRSQASVSAGMISQPDAPASRWGDATTPSFDQIGFVWVNDFGYDSYLNFAFNYSKGRSFQNISDVRGSLDNASQNALSFMKILNAGDVDFDKDDDMSQIDALYYRCFLADKDGGFYYNSADSYAHQRTTTGYTARYDFNISGCAAERWYLGMTLGFTDIQYSSWSTYGEMLLNGNGSPIGNLYIDDEREISGWGYNLKFGSIIFPVEDNPFRLGLSIETPTWYELTTTNSTTLDNQANTGGTPISNNNKSTDSYDFKIFTPWKFGVSVGTTLSNRIAIGAVYQYADYGSTKSRIIDGYDIYDDPYSSNDDDMNAHTKATLKGVSTLKLGAEIKPVPSLAFRLGYNYITPMYNKTGCRDVNVWSPGTFYSSQTDYTNWKETNRVTCGFGYFHQNFSFDLAYQFSNTNGEYHPFPDSNADFIFDDDSVLSMDNYADGVKVSKSRHQLLATFTYKF